MLYDVTYMWNLKQDRDEPINETEAESQCREQTGGCQEGWGEMGEGRSRKLGLTDVSFCTQNG